MLLCYQCGYRDNDNKISIINTAVPTDLAPQNFKTEVMRGTYSAN